MVGNEVTNIWANRRFGRYHFAQKYLYSISIYFYKSKNTKWMYFQGGLWFECYSSTPVFLRALIRWVTFRQRKQQTRIFQKHTVQREKTNKTNNDRRTTTGKIQLLVGHRSRLLVVQYGTFNGKTTMLCTFFSINGRRYQTCLGSSTTTFGYILTTHPVHNSAQTRVILDSREVFVGRQLAINKTPKQVQIFIYPVIWKILGLLSSPSGKSPSRLR